MRWLCETPRVCFFKSTTIEIKKASLMQPSEEQNNGAVTQDGLMGDMSECHYSNLTKLACDAKQFCDETDDDATTKQLSDRYRVMKETGPLAGCSPIDEKSCEDWVDIAARKIKREKFAFRYCKKCGQLLAAKFLQQR
eukprot:GHVN01105073.1.p1 GENE.GHVN01105073.1~~GHVN01105073.1.p1  ORF type:complete len:138 (-),score=25.17 GHVN01105073.1:1258-1671(-)